MRGAVYRMMTLLCALVPPLPIGTKLWLLTGGQSRAIRWAGAALEQGGWPSR